MKKLLVLSLAAAAYATAANAQTTVVTSGSAPAAETVTIAPESRTRIKTYVTEHKVAPIRTQERVAVGATLPADVELQTVPSDWGPNLTRYRYVYSDNHVVLVEPSSRRIIQIVD